ncbi:MAG: sugar phosphate nucleotidyltransferase [Brevinema sp.]
MHALLLAGGKGTRLWPLSQKNTPKQLLSPLGDDKSLLEHTVIRTQSVGFDSKNIHLVTTTDQSPDMQKVWNPLQLGCIIEEPCARNTGPAILLAAKKLMSNKIAEDESIFVFPTDAYLTDFQPNLNIKMKDFIFCYRIQPTRPETGYGYMQAHTGGIIRKVRLFKEKPNRETAEAWFDLWENHPEIGEEEKYFWNSGIYAFTINSLSCALMKIDAKLHEFWLNSSYEEFVAQYESLPKESFDTMVAENAWNLHCAPLPASSWRDIGSWESIHEALRSEKDENIVLGEARLIESNSKSCLISADKEYNIVCGEIENLAIIVKDNNILILDKSKPNTMQQLINKIQDEHPDIME